jgi:hypothetical protein
MKCAALDWNRGEKDYVPCDTSAPSMVRLVGLVTVEVPLCDAHRFQFKHELALHGGSLDKTKRVEVIR